MTCNKKLKQLQLIKPLHRKVSLITQVHFYYPLSINLYNYICFGNSKIQNDPLGFRNFQRWSFCVNSNFKVCC